MFFNKELLNQIAKLTTIAEKLHDENTMMRNTFTMLGETIKEMDAKISTLEGEVKNLRTLNQLDHQYPIAVNKWGRWNSHGVKNQTPPDKDSGCNRKHCECD
jgi:predicted RNase H-like nuclease (RuvC/YqgF family)